MKTNGEFIDAYLQQSAQSGSASLVGATGNFTIVIPEGMSAAEIERHATSDLRIAFSSDFSSEPLSPSQLLGSKEAGVVVFENLGLMAVSAEAREQTTAALAQGGADMHSIIIEPECYVQAIGDMERDLREYLQGYRQAVDDLTRRLLDQGAGMPEPEGIASANALSERERTWGVDAVGAHASVFTGRGIRLAVLDTGMATQHPDFAGRAIYTKIFTGEMSVEDLNGHGTHCIGTAAGPRNPAGVPRYGVACEAEIHALKVLNNGGSGVDNDILAAISWAVAAGCEVISMSLGKRRYVPGHDQRYEIAAQRALAAGSLIIGAAGNDSNRPYSLAPVSDPACCPSILSVAALDPRLRVASFSNAGLYGSGGEIDLAAPGVDVLSAFPPALGKSHTRMNGTSMATPHVAGIAALFAESSPGLRGLTLRNALLSACKSVGGSRADVGLGLVQAP